MKELIWEECACDACGSAQTDLLFEGPDRLMHLPGLFRMVRCRECGVVRQNPRLAWESLKDYYAEGYDSYAPLVREEKSALRRLDRRYGMWKQLRLVERHRREGRLLDVGCGTGLFLEEAQHSGRWELMGVEPTQAAADYAGRALGVPVKHGRFSDADLPEGHFDVITLWHVLEHLSQPVTDLRRAAGLLRPDGLLVFAVPSVESLGARAFGPAWVGWDLPRHLYLFPQPALARLLPEMGLQIVEINCMSLGYALLGHSLDFWSQTWPERRQTWRRWMLRLYYTLPVRAGMILPLWALDRLKLASVITVTARKTARPA